MAIPFLLLAILATAYQLYRNHKTGKVTFKIKHELFNRVNLDLLLSILLVCALCAYFLWSDLKKFIVIVGSEAGTVDGPLIYGCRIVFYIVLVAVFIAKQLERPALREKGISSARWFWPWDQIKSYKWSGTVLQFKIGTAKKQINETWVVVPEQKQELDRLLRKNIKKQGKKTKKGKSTKR